MYKRMSLIACVFVTGVTAWGCCTREKCVQDFGLSECTAAECVDQYGDSDALDVQGPDGPDVIISPGGGTQIIWTVNAANATDGGTIFDPAAPSYCRLRKDFIGKSINYYDYERVGDPQWREANFIELEEPGSGGILLRIKRSSNGRMDFWIQNKTTGTSCTLRKGPIPTVFTDIPTEFMVFTTSDIFKEVDDNQNAQKAKFQVKY